MASYVAFMSLLTSDLPIIGCDLSSVFLYRLKRRAAAPLAASMLHISSLGNMIGVTDGYNKNY